MSHHWKAHEIRVQYNETDQMGVVHHSNYINWFEVGRTGMIRESGISYRDMEELGLLLPVIDVHAKYHRPARYDERVIIYTKLAKLTPVVMEFLYEVRKKSATSEEEILLVEGKTTHMWINDEWRPTRLDRYARDVYEQLEQLKG